MSNSPERPYMGTDERVRKIKKANTHLSIFGLCFILSSQYVSHILISLYIDLCNSVKQTGCKRLLGEEAEIFLINPIYNREKKFGQLERWRIKKKKQAAPSALHKCKTRDNDEQNSPCFDEG